MVRSRLIVNSLAGVLFGTTMLWGGQALALDFKSLFKKDEDKAVCYVRTDRMQTLTMNVKKHSPLDITKKRSYKKANQNTYTAFGKVNFPKEENSGGLRTGSLYGRILTAYKKGARLSFTYTALLTPGEPEFTTFFQCASNEDSATPARWSCKRLFIIDNDMEDEIGVRESTFNRVNPETADPRVLNACNFYETFNRTVE